MWSPAYRRLSDICVEVHLGRLQHVPNIGHCCTGTDRDSKSKIFGSGTGSTSMPLCIHDGHALAPATIPLKVFLLSYSQKEPKRSTCFSGSICAFVLNKSPEKRPTLLCGRGLTKQTTMAEGGRARLCALLSLCIPCSSDYRGIFVYLVVEVKRREDDTTTQRDEGVYVQRGEKREHGEGAEICGSCVQWCSLCL